MPGCRFNDLLRQLQQLMSSTFNENISILLMGERGTGKTLVLRSVIRQMREDHPLQPLTEVYLNGFCVRDDSAALREIARQLQRASGGGGSAAEAAARDAMAAPAATTAKAAVHVPRTFAESMAELRTALEHTVGGIGSKAGRGRPIVLVLDEYDQFAAQNRQVRPGPSNNRCLCRRAHLIAGLDAAAPLCAHVSATDAAVQPVQPDS